MIPIVLCFPAEEEDGGTWTELGPYELGSNQDISS